MTLMLLTYFQRIMRVRGANTIFIHSRRDGASLLEASERDAHVHLNRIQRSDKTVHRYRQRAQRKNKFLKQN